MAFPVVNTDGGAKACVYTTQAGGSWPIHGAYEAAGMWFPIAWQSNGKHCPGFSANLDICGAIGNGEIAFPEAPKEPEQRQVDGGALSIVRNSGVEGGDKALAP